MWAGSQALKRVSPDPENRAQRAERAGFGTLVVTVDAPRLGRREADIKNGCALRALLLGFNGIAALTRGLKAVVKPHFFVGPPIAETLVGRCPDPWPWSMPCGRCNADP